MLNVLKSACSTKGGLDITTLVNDFGAFLAKDGIDKEVTNEEWVLAKSTFELASAFALVKDPNTRKESKCYIHVYGMGAWYLMVYTIDSKKIAEHMKNAAKLVEEKGTMADECFTHTYSLFNEPPSCANRELWGSYYFMECIPPSIYGLRGEQL